MGGRTDLAQTLPIARRAASSEPPAFWTGSAMSAAIVSGPSAAIAWSISASSACRWSRPGRRRRGTGSCWRRATRGRRPERLLMPTPVSESAPSVTP